MRLNNKKVMVIVLFVVFLFLRLFVDSKTIFFGGDSAKFLELAKHFPYHTLGNDQLYLQHGPVYPYAIHFSTLLFEEDYIAAIMINLLSASITFFLVYKLFMMITNRFDTTFIILILFTLSVDLIIASRKITRESFVIMLLISSIYFYIKGVKYLNNKSIMAASVLGAILGATSDHVVFLFPTFALSYLIFNSKKINLKRFILPNIMYALLPVLAMLVVYSSWLGVKYYHYSTNGYYPAGLEGSPLKAGNFGILELINPPLFEGYESETGIITHDFLSVVKKYAFMLGYMFNTEPFSITRGINLTTMKFLLFPRHIVYMLLVYLPLALVAVYGLFSILKDIWKSRKIYNNANLYILALFLIFMFPITQKVTSPRYIYPAYIYLFYIISYGIIRLLHSVRLLRENTKSLSILLVVLLILMLPFWYYHNSNFVPAAKKVVGSHNTADYINNNIKRSDAIMTQPGYTYRLLYQTENRIVSIPPASKDFIFLLKDYNISYVIFGKLFTSEKYHYTTDSVEYIIKNPDKFKLIATIEEDYSNFYDKKDVARTDETYVYSVKR